MDTDRRDKKQPTITLTLRLAPALARMVDKAALQADVVEELGEILRVLGMPGEPLVKTLAARKNALDTRCALSVTINGTRYPYSAELQHRVISYVIGAHLDKSGSVERVIDILTEQPPEQVALFVRLICGEIIKAKPACLLTTESVDVYRAMLVNEFKDAPLPDTERLGSLLASVLNMRIAIVDRATVAQVLKEGIAEGESDAAVSENLIASLRPKVLEVQLPWDYLKQITQHMSKDEQGNFTLMRDGLFDELGMRYPAIRLVSAKDLQSESFRLKINHLSTLPQRGLRPDECLVNDTPDRLRLLDMQARVAAHPANANPVAIIHIKDKPQAEAAELTTWSQIGYLILALSRELRTHSACFLDLQVCQDYLDDLEAAFPELVEAARAKISPELMTQTLRLLLAEEIAIRNLRHILQAMVDYDYIVVDDPKYIVFDTRLTAHVRPSDAWLHDPINITSYVRSAMKRYISHKYTRGQSTLIVELLDLEIEEFLRNRQMMLPKMYLTRIDPRDQERLLAAVRREIGQLPPSAATAVILTSSSVRPILRELIASEFPQLAVVAYSELSPELNIQPISRISWS